MKSLHALFLGGYTPIYPHHYAPVHQFVWSLYERRDGLRGHNVSAAGDWGWICGRRDVIDAVRCTSLAPWQFPASSPPLPVSLSLHTVTDWKVKVVRWSDPIQWLARCITINCNMRSWWAGSGSCYTSLHWHCSCNLSMMQQQNRSVRTECSLLVSDIFSN